ncbi:hypothetical protein AQ477_29605 [Burkholderia thailandensis]|nr:hypothetical protein AQ477_29605 [Burkholderia thailandensis]KXF57558.1 hypothetical protein AQ476_22505 [Burkholderia thailandensis]
MRPGMPGRDERARYFTGVRTGAPSFLSRSAANFAGFVVLAFRRSCVCRSGPRGTCRPHAAGLPEREIRQRRVGKPGADAFVDVVRHAVGGQAGQHVGPLQRGARGENRSGSRQLAT